MPEVVAFPSASLLDDPAQDLDLRTRAVLGWLMEAKPLTPENLPDDNVDCPNCGAFVGSKRTPYCGDPCQEESAFVRQFRSATLSGAIQDPEKQAMLGQKLWRLLGGGFPRREGLVPGRVLNKILEREKGLCQLCGAPAVRIDHPGSG